MNTQTTKANDTDHESTVPTSTAAIHLLLAREGDRVAITSEADAEDDLSESEHEDEHLFDVAEIGHERDLREKALKLTQPGGETRAARRVVRDDTVTVAIVDREDATSATVDTFRVVNRSLGITSETWEPRERDPPLERYREVRIDEAARPALTRLIGWLAETLQIDERTGNGSWRENRDEVLASAYRLQQPGAADSFTIETVTLDIVNSALDTARRRVSGDEKGDQPFDEAFLAAIDEQVETPGLEDWAVGENGARNQL